MEDLEWKTIPKKRTGSKPANAKPADKAAAAVQGNDWSQRSSSEILNDVHQSKMALRSSTYFKFVISSICGRLESADKFATVLSFGIGSLSTPTSLLQLAIYLCLCEEYLNGTMEQGSGIFDPNITSVDVEVYDTLRIPVLTENTKGKHTIAGTGRTLFFLPHCPYRLYCNILWANWEQLDRVYIYGNSFNSYSVRRGTTTIDNNKKKSTKTGKAKAMGESTVAVPADPTDTVALLSPYFTEVDLWPSVGNFTPIAHTMPTTATVEASIDATAAVLGGASPRTAFLKEAKTVAELRHLENAMCDISFMYLSREAAADASVLESIAAMKPSEELIDEAALMDVELF